MVRAYSWTTAETIKTDSMAAVRNFLLDSCRDQRRNGGAGLNQSSGVSGGICATEDTLQEYRRNPPG